MTEHIFTYSRVTRNVKYRSNSAKTKSKLDLKAEEILDEMLNWDGTELWARLRGDIPMNDAVENFCQYIKHRYPDAIINPLNFHKVRFLL